jgi:1,4-alpha-glucan branching enzyme
MENGLLRYHFLSDYDRAMIMIIKENNCLDEPFPYKCFDQEQNQVLGFLRGGLLFIFNFNPNQSFTGYGIKAPAGKYKLILDSDDALFGGFGRIDHSITYFTQSLGKLATGSENVLKIYLPARVGLVFKKIPTPRVR